MRAGRAGRGAPGVPDPVAGPPATPTGAFDLPGWHLLARVMRLRRTLPRSPPRLLDLGMGRGRDLIYFARRGFRVHGIDLDPVAVERARRRAGRRGVPLSLAVADLRSVRFRGRFDVVFSSSALNFLPAGVRRARFACYRAVTWPGGLHAVNAFVTPGGARPFPALGTGAVGFRPGELRGYYRGWEIVEQGAEEFVPPAALGGGRARLEVVVARRPVR